MSFRFDTTRRFTGALLAALLVVALAVPACMTLVCITSPMSGDGMMGGMSVTECLDAAATHDGLLAASQGSALATVMVFVALLGLVVAGVSSAPLADFGWAPAPITASPPPPMDPRGERLLV